MMPSAIVWDDDLIAQLCDEIAGGRAIHEIAETESWCPGEASIYRKMAKDEAFRSAISSARAAQQEREADECIRMADLATPDDWQVVKLRIWARQWRASKLAPKKYGDKLELSGDAQNPLHVKQTIDASKLSTDVLAQLIAAKDATNES
jgi:hypothetical protein